MSEVLHKDRVLNTLYYILPRNKIVEMMSGGHTLPAIILTLAGQMEAVELRPVAMSDGESKGIIFCW